MGRSLWGSDMALHTSMREKWLQGCSNQVGSAG